MLTKTGQAMGKNTVHFTQEQCDQLYEMICVDDDINLDVTLPEKISLDYTQLQLVESFQICRQLWMEGLDEAGYQHILNRLCHSCNLTDQEKAVYKKVRAKFKHLCYAFQAFDTRHQKPYGLDKMTGLLGKLQDGFKNHKEWIVKPRAYVLKKIWNEKGLSVLTFETSRFFPCDTTSFIKNIQKRIASIKKQMNGQVTVSSYQFHSLRKHISLLAATFGTFDVLFPSAYHHQLFQYTATINGLMGDYHDTLIEKKLNNTQNYYFDQFQMPEEIASRLKEFVNRLEQVTA